MRTKKTDFAHQVVIIIILSIAVFLPGKPLKAASLGFLKKLQFTDPVDKKYSREEILSLAKGRRFYLDPVHGHDSKGDGSSARPWKSLAKAQAMVRGGDVVLLRTGKYGAFVRKGKQMKSHSNYIIYINDTGAKPFFNRIELYNTSKAFNPRLSYIFSGIQIKPRWVDPASSGKNGSNDPYYRHSKTNTYAKTKQPISLYGVSNVKIFNCDIRGANRFLTRGPVIHKSDHISIVRCSIQEVRTGILYKYSTCINLYNNNVFNIAGSHFKGGGFCKYVNIESNYGHDRNWTFKDAYIPKSKGHDPHGSYVSIRSSYTVVRNNVFHNGGGSSGIMLYKHQKGEKAYTNVLIENNVVYDTHNNFVLRIYKLGKNIVVRNNTLVGRGRNSKHAGHKYNTALILHSVGPGYDGSGLHLYNNIFVGSVNLGKWMKNVKKSNNIYWSVTTGKNKIIPKKNLHLKGYVVTGERTAPPYFASGFFRGKLDVSWADIKLRKPSVNSPGHGHFIDFRLDKHSPAINFGNPIYQPKDSLGQVVNGFIENNGKKRSMQQHNAGAYQ